MNEYKLYWILIAVNFCIAAVYLVVLRNLLVDDINSKKKRENSVKKERKVAVNFQRGSRLSVQTAGVDVHDEPSSQKPSTSSDV